MWHDGIKCNYASHLGYRMGDPSRDVDLYGDPVQSNYVAIVSKKKCPTYEKDGKWYYEPKDAPMIPMTHGGTYYGYGMDRIKNGWLEDIDGHMFWGYFTTPYYVVKSGRVYQGTLRGLYPSYQWLEKHYGFDWQTARQVLEELKRIKDRIIQNWDVSPNSNWIETVKAECEHAVHSYTLE